MKTPETAETKRPRGRRIAGRAQDDGVDDPYQLTSKPHGPAVCPECGVVFRHGRWEWAPSRPGAERALCPACRRTADDNPAGVVTLQGSFVPAHADEIVHLVRHQEQAEKRDHPMNRIIALRRRAEGMEITTTDIHLPCRIGEALGKAYRGELAIERAPDQYFVRVHWKRDASGG